MLNGTHLSSKIKKDDHRVLAAYHGWHDALNGRSLDPMWSDHPSRALSGTYHNWRLRATAVKFGGYNIPTWRTKRQVPTRVFEACIIVTNDAIRKGEHHAVPATKMPADPDLNFCR